MDFKLKISTPWGPDNTPCSAVKRLHVHALDAFMASAAWNYLNTASPQYPEGREVKTISASVNIDISADYRTMLVEVRHPTLNKDDEEPLKEFLELRLEELVDYLVVSGGTP